LIPAILAPVTQSDRNGNRPDRNRLAALESPVTVRLAAQVDAGALERVAGLDSRPLPPGPHLVAEREGRIDAALSLSTDELIADPFRRTAELCDLLRCHASGLRATPRPSPFSRLEPRPLTVQT
jgi:hypothetical protein